MFRAPLNGRVFATGGPSVSSPGFWQHLTEGDNVDPSQLFLAQIRLPLHSLSKVQSPALTSQGFPVEHLFEIFRTSKISRNPKFQFTS